jgi:hypothetical protein
VREITRRSLVWEQHGDVVVGKVRDLEPFDNFLSLSAVCGDTEYGFF